MLRKTRFMLWPAVVLVGAAALSESLQAPSPERDASPAERTTVAGRGEATEGPATMKSARVVRSDTDWRRILTPLQYRIAREKGTEPPFSGVFNHFQEEGTYHCAACHRALFGSDAKFDSGCGWPAFSRPLNERAVAERADASHGMNRTEVYCPYCDAHLGHVFRDGPAPTGLRYCLNSAILDFKPAPALAKKVAVPDKAQPVSTNAAAAKPAKALFAAGCFWGVEAAFRRLHGVLDATVGYTGGSTPHPTYRDVCTDRTGHAETVEVTYNPAQLTYAQLLETFWNLHDPTLINRQGPDIGRQYRSAIFYLNEEQRAAAAAAKQRLAESGRFTRRIATAIEPAGTFWKAEEQHQRYLEKQGAAVCR